MDYAATDGLYLPPPKQILFTPTITASIIVLAAAILVVAYFAVRARVNAKKNARLDALRRVERILLKRGGTDEDADRMQRIFELHRDLDPAIMTLMREKFHDELRPLLDVTFEAGFGERMEEIYFPPAHDTRHALAGQERERNVMAAIEDQKTVTASQNAAAIMDLMDATLRTGTAVRLVFEGLEGGHGCVVMGHDSQGANVTLPANNDALVAALRPGLRIEGTLESGPSLMAFTSSVVQAVAGSMPYCRIAPWKSAWEVRKRDSVRLPLSLEIDFQHISTAAASSINMSNLKKEIGTLRPGRLVDISLGGCAVETPSNAQFRVGDMIRFSKPLAPNNPPATLLGAVVKADAIDPEEHEGAGQLLHVQFLVIDDVSQRILVRALRQLQDAADREEWTSAQKLLQQMHRANIPPAGAPGGGTGRGTGKA